MNLIIMCTGYLVNKKKNYIFKIKKLNFELIVRLTVSGVISQITNRISCL